ncbi:OmpA family protein [Thalassovita mediterranea]|jgi:OOP family OmpA-OmpF porin|uniref:Inner membrane lipoprotein YiaD n=1 Tax=Thalassovita mediterranea TaxID=340021 RepID=A0A0P1GRH1_9RHOB|nr:OmpA family protein [Thalassovita mediterranea]MCG7572865.1 OmpA family protein [Phaeobacter sp. CNT1-3]CUH85270.1 Inner membrane lipoprotein YiaD precursor [Thalassovita mediterranea]SIS30571.1 OmpA-OmpF porin, OOP family [Thalassovita mediterranea]
MRLNALLAAALLLPSMVGAAPLSLTLPGNSTVLSDEVSALDAYALPIGAYRDGALPVKNLTGQVQRSSWRVGSQGLTALQVLTPLEQQLTELGYEVLFRCATQACGGFDFRFETEVFAAPAMHVDLGDFHFISLRQGDEDHLSLFVSRSANAGFIQLIRVTPEQNETTNLSTNAAANEGPQLSAVSRLNTAPFGDDLIDTLQDRGHVVLGDLTFETGSADLGAADFASLAALARYLNADANRRVALVGHTDAVGALDRNIALSRRRAASVRDRLISTLGVNAEQLDAEGMGYLAPRASNLTNEGREENRRVEAVLLNTE